MPVYRIGDFNGYPPGDTPGYTSWETWKSLKGQNWHSIFMRWTKRVESGERGFREPNRVWQRGGRGESRSNNPILPGNDEDSLKFVHGFYAQFFDSAPTSTGGVGNSTNLPWSNIGKRDPSGNSAFAGTSYNFKTRSFAGGGGLEHETITQNDLNRTRKDFRTKKLNGQIPKNDTEKQQEEAYIENNAYKYTLERNGIPYVGYKVRSLNKGPFDPGNRSAGPDVGLFQANSTDHAGRFDCVTIGGNTWCVFTDSEYGQLKRKLQALEDQYKTDLNAGRTVSGNTAVQYTKAQKKAQQKLIQGRKAWNAKYGKKQEVNKEADLRLRIVNAQACLILSMAKIVDTTGTKILRLADHLDPKKNPDVYPTVEQIQRVRHSSLISYDGNPNALTNLLANPFPITRFMDATPAELAHLQPRLQFFIDGRAIQFPDYTLGKKTKDLADIRGSKVTTARRDEILKSRGMEGTDVGIKSFDWSLENKMEGNSS